MLTFHCNFLLTYMLSEHVQQQIHAIWDRFVAANRPVIDTKGRAINDIDGQRLRAISDIRTMIYSFLNGTVSIGEFKTTLDGYNKRNNLWGFTAAKGQMFFNQLVKASDADISGFTDLLKQSINEPANIDDAFDKLTRFELHVQDLVRGVKDRRKAPNPGSSAYFLSYFWQIHDHNRFPIYYTSLVKSFDELGIWSQYPSQRHNYENFVRLNELIKAELSQYTKSEIGNWDVEHAFWLKLNTNNSATPKRIQRSPQTLGTEIESVDDTLASPLAPTFDVNDYLIPKVAPLIQLCTESDKSKASRYENLVADIFGLLDFEVEYLGQGSGRNPDAILKFREDHTAFIVDAKAYKDGYSLGASDERAIREYINHHCPKLIKEGFRRIGFIIVSNSFKSTFDDFTNEITWTTDIKRFILLTSEALLYLLAYKTKDKLPLSSIIENVVSSGNLIESKDVIQKFDDI